ncbi:hypothetical protein [Aeromonas sp. R9-2]|uniref:hypothetical protein n=1 Tax=Aeromonas sp. R9-2 TaxID=3138479 RepID=UPI0034A5B120
MKFTNKSMLSLSAEKPALLIPLEHAEFSKQHESELAEASPIASTSQSHVRRYSDHLIIGLFLINLVAAFYMVLYRYHIAVPATPGWLVATEFAVGSVLSDAEIYETEWIFPAFSEQMTPQSQVQQRRHIVQVGVYRDPENVEKWRRWAHQQQVELNVITGMRNQEIHYDVYLCRVESERLAELTSKASLLSGEKPIVYRWRQGHRGARC